MAAAALAVVALGAGGCSSHPRNPYAGGHFTPQFPSFLPARSLHPADDRVLTGTTAKPALSVQGESVRVETPAWSVLVDVQGPVVPGEGLPVQTPATTCTWTVTMSQATATVPVSLVDFNSVDHLGHIYQLTAVEGQPAPPTAVAPGQTVRFQLRAYEAVGEGIMRWAPDRQHIVAMWDYEVEND